MPRHARGPHLFLKRRSDGQAIWYMREGSKRTSTGVPEHSVELAEGLMMVGGRMAAPVKFEFLNARYHAAKQRAQRKGRAFTITVRDIWEIGVSQQWRCALTGLPFAIDGDPWTRPRALSIDRIDAAKGYERENVRLILVAMNAALGRWGVDEFAVIAEAFLHQDRQRKNTMVLKRTRRAEARRDLSD